jgi:hypothetical protein
MSKKVYTKEEIGCWIDGTFGLDHAMRKLAEIAEAPIWLSDADSREIEAIAVLATGDPTKLSDDHHEFDLATDYLAQHTDDDLSWLWEGGDLILTQY